MSQHASIRRRAWKKTRQYVSAIFNFAAKELMDSNVLFRTLQGNRVQHERLMQYLEMCVLSLPFVFFA